MQATVVEANDFNKERVPVGFDKPPAVAIVLPTAKYTDMINSQTSRSFSYHLLTHAKYSLLNPIDFDADSFVEKAIEYCRKEGVRAVMAFDCFPTMMSSMIAEELKLPGPSSWSIFVCCNKYYMRTQLTPEVQPLDTTPGESVPKCPAVLKVSDTQFYVGTRICKTEDAWKANWQDLTQGLVAAGLEARQQFYFKWGKHFRWPTAWKAPADVVLVHSEPRISYKGEYQAEVVVLANGQLVMADTGDIEHADGLDAITVFKTPGTFMLTPVLKDFLRRVAGKLSEVGYKSAAMDIEFARLDQAEEAYQVVEINSRYSYMGNYIHFGLDKDAQSSKKYAGKQEQLEVRNLLNRTRLALGAEPAKLPSRDHPGLSKIAAMLYTNRAGPVNEVFDSQALQALIDDDTLDAFTPKQVYQRGVITEADLREYQGWAKIGVLLMSWEDNLTKINSKLDIIVSGLFRGKGDTFLPIKVIDEDGPGPTGLRPDALQDVGGPPGAGKKDEAPKKKKTQSCACGIL
mmetsp:Transcript_88392/g.250515  ORF Transcript_88392/g.250515 Transcript_88392/m.250515 type:complete len:515 (+) Transcript_88392:76-1620(+)